MDNEATFKLASVAGGVALMKEDEFYKLDEGLPSSGYCLYVVALVPAGAIAAFLLLVVNAFLNQVDHGFRLDRYMPLTYSIWLFIGWVLGSVVGGHIGKVRGKAARYVWIGGLVGIAILESILLVRLAIA